MMYKHLHTTVYKENVSHRRKTFSVLCVFICLCIDELEKVDDLATFEQNGVAKYLKQEKQASDAVREQAQASSANNERRRRGQCSWNSQRRTIILYLHRNGLSK